MERSRFELLIPNPDKESVHLADSRADAATDPGLPTVARAMDDGVAGPQDDVRRVSRGAQTDSRIGYQQSPNLWRVADEQALELRLLPDELERRI